MPDANKTIMGPRSSDVWPLEPKDDKGATMEPSKVT
jgi:hypothetical protein